MCPATSGTKLAFAVLLSESCRTTDLHATSSAFNFAHMLLKGAHHNNVGKQADAVCIEILADFLPPFHDVLQHPN